MSPLFGRTETPPLWASLEIFQGLGQRAMKELEAVLEPVDFPAGTEIIKQGAEGRDMFLLDNGAVRIVVKDENGQVGFERLLKAPAHFGEMALIIREPRTASVIAETDVHCKRMARPALQQLVRRNPDAAGFLTRAVGERLLEAGTIRQVGQYHVVGKLGVGGVATVFEANDPKLDRPVALKMLSHALVMQPGFAERFLKEARIVARLEHEHIVRVWGIEEAFATHFIVMEKLNGTLLEDIVAGGIRLPYGTQRKILEECCLGLAYSHNKRILHRDIKPANIFLTIDRKVKILDFGIAVEPERSAARDRRVSGTPWYMAPEQIRGETLDGRCDLYALGITAYELATGLPPYDHDDHTALMRMHLERPMPDPRSIVPDIPDDLVEFIRRTTAKRPEERFDSAAQAARFLAEAAETEQVVDIEISSVTIAYNPGRRDQVDEAIAHLRKRLDGVPGISILRARASAAEKTID